MTEHYHYMLYIATHTHTSVILWWSTHSEQSTNGTSEIEADRNTETAWSMEEKENNITWIYIDIYA